MQSYTPLRYPGGKAKIFPYVKKFIESNYEKKPVYAEPFAGGCGLALKLLHKDIVDKIIINDNDYAIFCFWHSILFETDAFIDLVYNAHFSIEEWERQKRIYLNWKNQSKLEVGFATFFLNRCNRSGIILAGPIGGKKQDGEYLMNCRFNKENLVQIIVSIKSLKSRIKLHRVDANQFIKYIDARYDNLLFYLDPPYVKKGKQLYKNHFIERDHRRLAKNILKLNNDWIVTYDNTDLIKSIYKDFEKQEFSLLYTAGEKRKGDEILIFKDTIKNKLNINQYL